MISKRQVLMCSSSLNYQGGMTSVVKNYLDYPDWGEFSLHFVPTHVTGGKIKVLAHFAKVLPTISKELANHTANLVHLHVAERGSFFRKAIIVRKAVKNGVPVILHHHAAEFEKFYSSLDSRGKTYVRRTCEMANINIVLSENIKTQMVEHFPGAFFEVLHNAVPVYSENQYSPGGRYITFIGRVGERKGTYDLIRAFFRVQSNISDEYRLVICGDGEIEKARELAFNLGLGDRVECRGWVGPEERKDILRNAALNVLPSYNEGLPMSILEAMSFGVPTLSTRIAAIPEVISSGVNGWLVNPGDIDAMAEVIVKAVNDEEARLSASSNAYALICNAFSLGHHINLLKEMYRDLC